MIPEDFPLQSLAFCRESSHLHDRCRREFCLSSPPEWLSIADTQVLDFLCVCHPSGASVRSGHGTGCDYPEGISCLRMRNTE